MSRGWTTEASHISPTSRPATRGWRRAAGSSKIAQLARREEERDEEGEEFDRPARQGLGRQVPARGVDLGHPDLGGAARAVADHDVLDERQEVAEQREELSATVGVSEDAPECDGGVRPVLSELGRARAQVEPARQTGAELVAADQREGAPDEPHRVERGRFEHQGARPESGLAEDRRQKDGLVDPRRQVEGISEPVALVVQLYRARYGIAARGRHRKVHDEAVLADLGPLVAPEGERVGAGSRRDLEPAAVGECECRHLYRQGQLDLDAEVESTGEAGVLEVGQAALERDGVRESRPGDVAQEEETVDQVRFAGRVPPDEEHEGTEPELRLAKRAKVPQGQGRDRHRHGSQRAAT